jgi:hypothetical protein
MQLLGCALGQATQAKRKKGGREGGEFCIPMFKFSAGWRVPQGPCAATNETSPPSKMACQTTLRVRIRLRFPSIWKGAFCLLKVRGVDSCPRAEEVFSSVDYYPVEKTKNQFAHEFILVIEFMAQRGLYCIMAQRAA